MSVLIPSNGALPGLEQTGGGSKGDLGVSWWSSNDIMPDVSGLPASCNENHELVWDGDVTSELSDSEEAELEYDEFCIVVFFFSQGVLSYRLNYPRNRCLDAKRGGWTVA